MKNIKKLSVILLLSFIFLTIDEKRASSTLEGNKDVPINNLKAKDLFLGNYFTNKNEKYISNLVKEGVILNLEKAEGALPKFEEAARHGSSTAMYQLGQYYKEKDSQEANKWYFLTFQRCWETTGNIHENASSFLIDYSVDGDQPNIALKSFFHSFNIKAADDNIRFDRLNSVYEGYEKGFLETNLSEEEKDLKKAHILDLIPNITPSPQAQYLTAYYQRLHVLGVLYKKKIKSKNFEKIASLFERSQEPNSKFNLGNMYLKKNIGEKLSFEERNNKAKELFEKADTPDANFNLGIMYIDGDIGQELSEVERYKKAQVYFKKSSTPDSLHALALLLKEKLD